MDKVVTLMQFFNRINTTGDKLIYNFSQLKYKGRPKTTVKARLQIPSVIC